MAEQGFTLWSPDFNEGGKVPVQFTCDGANTPPTLNWMHAPPETRSFVLIVDDPDAPQRTFTHWVLFDLPANTYSLGKETPTQGTSGKNDFQHDGYGGPCPPPQHGEHRYFFSLYALDVESLNLEPRATHAEVEQAIQGHILDQTMLMGRYQRRGSTS